MTHNELVATVSKMIHDSLLDRVTTKELAKEIVAVVEPVIRADERGVSEALADLRAKARLRAQVETLRGEVKLVRGVERPSASEGALIAYSRVLELLNGGSGA